MMSKRKLFLIGSGLAVLVGLGACLKAGDGVGLDSSGNADPCVAGPTTKACTTSTCLKTPAAPMCAVVAVDSCTLPIKPSRCSAVVAKTHFTTSVWPIISATENHCLQCHIPNGAGSILEMDSPQKAYTNLVNVKVFNQILANSGAPGWKRVVPGKPDNSMLFKKITGKLNSVVRYDSTDQSLFYGGTMPLGGYPKLPQASIDTIQKWILEGALQ